MARRKQQRREGALQFIDETLEWRPLATFSATHLELLELLFAYWRETEVAEDAPVRGSDDLGGATSWKANCSCIRAADAEHGRGEGPHANRQRCRTAAAECTAENRQALRRGIRMRSSTGVTRLRRSPTVERSRHC